MGRAYLGIELRCGGHDSLGSFRILAEPGVERFVFALRCRALGCGCSCAVRLCDVLLVPGASLPRGFVFPFGRVAVVFLS